MNLSLGSIVCFIYVFIIGSPRNLSLIKIKRTAFLLSTRFLTITSYRIPRTTISTCPTTSVTKSIYKVLLVYYLCSSKERLISVFCRTKLLYYLIEYFIFCFLCTGQGYPNSTNFQVILINSNIYVIPFTLFIFYLFESSYLSILFSNTFPLESNICWTARYV